MGGLALPEHGTVYLDANSIIYSVERIEPYRTVLQPRALLQYSSDMRLIAITHVILEQAASLRATITIKTPDAIHAATALLAGCALFVTNDNAFRRVPGLPVALLSEALPPEEGHSVS